MKQSLKFAAAAAALLAAAGAYAGSDDGKSDNAWIAKDVATLHMEPQVIVSANEYYNYQPYSLSMSAPAPTASAAIESDAGTAPAAFAEPGVVTETTTFYYAPTPVVPSSPMVDNNTNVVIP